MNYRHADFQSAARADTNPWLHGVLELSTVIGHTSVTKRRRKWHHLGKEIIYGRHRFGKKGSVLLQNPFIKKKMQELGLRSKNG